ncbi:MAG: helix-turn-helix domain-containing protein, partial [Woeseiaceae bacterium]
MSDRDQFVDVPEAGRVLGVSDSTVWRMIRRGALPSIRRGGRRLVPRRALKQGAR